MNLETERPVLRQWQQGDLSVFAEINSNELAMEHFPGLFTEQESNDLASRIIEEISSSGWGLWAAELKSARQFIGFIGLSTPRPAIPFFPCVEIGWRLHPKFWGKGYATEGAEKSLAYAFDHAELKEVFAMTAVTNSRSVAVMKRLGMKDTHQNFIHPDIPSDSPIAEHFLYRITRQEWQKNGV
ncbi:MAG: GNAT family N-acetyltransferase [Pseudomonadota bacterium]